MIGRTLLLILGFFANLALAAPPNVVLIFVDDLGYADLGCYGSKGQPTPHLDRMASEGMRFTDFYVSSPVCSASRAALLTGCYHERVSVRGALGPGANKGLHLDEVTLADLLKSKGYATGMAGKWHLGDKPSLLPPAQGFDEYMGLPYSNDMWPYHPERPNEFPKLPLIEGTQIIDPDVTADDQKQLTARYTERATAFIRKNKQQPFLFYLAHSMPHVPLFVSDKFAGKSQHGPYGDVIAEIDWSVGEILKTLEECGLTENTLVIFTSDNGPWLSYGDHAGSAGPLREGKGTSFEGGIRVPMIARWPGKIPANKTCSVPTATIDIFPTIAALVDAPLPERKIDGANIKDILLGKSDAPPPHEALFFHFLGGELQAMRSGNWKLIFPHTSRTLQGAEKRGQGGIPAKYNPLKTDLALYDLVNDIGETKNLAAEKPEIVAQLQAMAAKHRQALGDSLTNTKGTEIRPPGE